MSGGLGKIAMISGYSGQAPAETMCLDCLCANRSCPVYPIATLVCHEFRPFDERKKAWELWLAENALRADDDAPRFWSLLCRVAA